MGGDLAARRRLAEFITEPAVVKKLVEQIAPALQGPHRRLYAHHQDARAPRRRRRTFAHRVDHVSYRRTACRTKPSPRARRRNPRRHREMAPSRRDARRTRVQRSRAAALRLSARYNSPTRATARISASRPTALVGTIPAVPAAAFKEATLTTFDPATAALVFETSGTTRGAPGRHYMETSELYDAASAGRIRPLHARDGARLRTSIRSQSGRAPAIVARLHDGARRRLAAMDGRAGICGDELLFDSFCGDVQAAIEQGQPVCLAATAFALVNLLDGFDEARLRFALPPGSRVMETGGFKGRTRVVDRDELSASARFSALDSNLSSPSTA